MKAETSPEADSYLLSITVDPALNKIFKGKNLFPEKLAKANEFLAKHPLPEHLKKTDGKR